MVNGNVSEAMFKKLMSGYEQMQEELSGQRIVLKAELNEIRDDTKYIKGIVDEFKAKKYIETLDRETVVELIEHIEVFKKEKTESGYIQRVDTYFNFIGKINHTYFDNLKGYLKDKVSRDLTEQQQVV